MTEILDYEQAIDCLRELSEKREIFTYWDFKSFIRSRGYKYYMLSYPKLCNGQLVEIRNARFSQVIREAKKRRIINKWSKSRTGKVYQKC